MTRVARVEAIVVVLAALSLTGCIGIGVVTVKAYKVPVRVDAPRAYERDPLGYRRPVTSMSDVRRLAGKPHRITRSGGSERWQYLLGPADEGCNFVLVAGVPVPVLPFVLPAGRHSATLIFRGGQLVALEGTRQASERRFCYLINVLDLGAGQLYGCGRNLPGVFSGRIGKLEIDAPFTGQ